MALSFRILGSGSGGNAALLQTDDTRVLVDAGFSARRLNEMLVEAGESLASINAILITHEHGDHSACLKGLAKHPHIQVFANVATSRTLQRALKHRISWQLFETGSTFRFRDLEITSFSVPHDAQDPVGFSIIHGHDGDLFNPRRQIVWLTDLGHIPAHIQEHIRHADILAIESNHCADLLQADAKRPWSLKQRIQGRHGHLSNTAVHDLLAEINSPAWQHIFLTHLSQDCNTIEAVELALSPSRSRWTCQITILAPGDPSAVVSF